MTTSTSSRETGRTTSSGRVHAVAGRIVKVYTGCALMLFNTLLLYLVFNLVLGAAIWTCSLFRSGASSATDPVTARYGEGLLDSVYPGFTRAERGKMLSENWNRPYIYEDFTHFQERPYNGKYVNVLKEGFRKCADQGPWPPARENFNIFVFGGSSTFGYGLPDNETVPSFLQKELSNRTAKRICVYNFGVGWYYSTQERIRFEKLLSQNYIPQMAVFIDGINETMCTSNQPAFSREMAQAFERVSAFDESQSPSQPGSEYWKLVREVCVERLPAGVAREYLSRKFHHEKHNPAPQVIRGHDQFVQGCRNYLMNKAIIEQVCGRFGVAPVFVWQPAPGYKYEAKYHLFARADADAAIHDCYDTMLELLQKEQQPPDFLWCADIQEGRRECLYCDHLHYTAAFSQSFARRICELCLERKLLPL